MSQKSITRYLKSLEEKGAIKIGNYNKRTSDKTGWYTIPTEFALKKEVQLPLSQNDSTLSQNDSTLPNINPAINPNTKTTIKAAAAVAVDNSLSETQKACWEWAKKEKFWSGKVYSEKAFLSLYNAESGALKGQFENWQELNKTEEEKKVKPKVPEVWERQGFKTEKEYNDFMFKQQTEKYTKTKTGSPA